MSVDHKVNRGVGGKWMLVGLAAFAIGLTVAAAWAVRDRSFAQRFEEQVRANLPLGTPREQVVAWLRDNNPHMPRYRADALRRAEDEQLQGKSIPALAGFDPATLGGMVRATAIRGDWAAKLTEDYVRVYLFLDKEEKVAGYYFLTWDELVAMERRNARF